MFLESDLAINGGTKVRDKAYPPAYPGASCYDEEEKKAVCEVIDNKSPYRYYGPNVLGKVKEFEKNFKEKFGSEYALGVTSGTAALMVALKACGIGPGDKVIVPSCTFLATPGSVVCAGAVPVFADIDESMNIDPDAIENVVDKYTKAVIAVPILGNPCNMERIMEVCKKHNLLVIEDVAQSCGASYNGKALGTYGDIGCFSLQMNKIITTGDGGIIVTNNQNLYERAVRYHDQGMLRERDGFLSKAEIGDVFIGQNYRMSEISGAVASVQLTKLDEIIKRMRWAKDSIKERIKEIPKIGFRTIQDEEGDCGNALVLLLEDATVASNFRKAVSAEGIPCGFLYNGEPIYMLPQIFNKRSAEGNGFPFNQFDEEITYHKDMCPNAWKVMQRSAMISISPVMTQSDVDDVVVAIKKVASFAL